MSRKRAERILLHICCGPCAAGSLPLLEAQGLAPEGFFYNPNIHPVTEMRARAGALKAFAEGRGLPVSWREDYGLVDFARHAAWREAERCEYCYALRLREAAAEARRRKLGLFTSTLLHSIHQKHNLIRDIGEQAAREAGVDFLYLDLREGWAAGRQAWRKTALYYQKYCGCLYSEMERYLGRRAGGRPRGEGGL